MSSPEVGKRYLPVRRIIPKVRKHNIVAVFFVGKANFPHKRALKSVGD